ncbi:MAG TPA: YciI family protein [Chloroflexia bacterium]|nr:YciI family protein [Chloroflexia bacterium]
MAKYMLVLKGGNDVWATYTPEQAQAMMQKYADWTEDIRKKGIMVNGDPLEQGGRVLSVRNGEVVDGPYTETKEDIVGYYIIQADNYDNAAEISKSCPTLLHGGEVELHAIAVM